VQIRVQAIGVTWYDVLWRQNLASSQAQLPAGLGSEMAGVITAVGEGVNDLKVGDKVASFPSANPNSHPVYGEQIVLPRTSVTKYPDILTPNQAAVHYTPMLVAYFAYVELARVKEGQTAFLQLGKALGLKVIAAIKTDDEEGTARQYLTSLGADKVVVTEEQDLLMAVNKYTDKRGVDVVLDGLGGPQMSILGDVLAPRGSLILYGLQGGNQVQFPACAAFQKNIQFFVHCVGNFTGKPELGIAQDKEAVERALLKINELTRDKLLLPQLTKVFQFDQIVEAHRVMDGCPVGGRVVVEVESA
jgi:NADPH:quinone reductase-like Zn-dependent oxidoreductase